MLIILFKLLKKRIRPMIKIIIKIETIKLRDTTEKLVKLIFILYFLPLDFLEIKFMIVSVSRFK